MEEIKALKKAIQESRKSISIIESNIEVMSNNICRLLIESIRNGKLTHIEAMSEYHKLLDVIISKVISDTNDFRETPSPRVFEHIRSSLLSCGNGFGVHNIDFYLEDFALTKSYDETLDVLFGYLDTEKEINDLIEYIISNNIGQIEIN